MSEFSPERMTLIGEAQARALQFVLASSFPVKIEEDYAREYIARRIAVLAAEGDWTATALANAAIGNLRDTIQMRESAQRIARTAL